MSTGVDRGGAGPRPAPSHPGFPPPRPRTGPIPPPPPSPPGYSPYEPYEHYEPYPPNPYASYADRQPHPQPSPEPPPPYVPAPHAAPRRHRPVLAAVCMVLGLGLLGGAAVGALINHDPLVPAPTAAEASASAYGATRDLWHSTPVNTLFPPTVKGRAAGPGGSDRTWTRIGIAPASGCADAFDPLLAKLLAPIGCVRLLRATYADATSTDVTTVGILVTKSDAATMRALHDRWNDEHLGARTDLMPRPVAFAGTAASGFGDKQRASWTVAVSADLPVVVYAVTGFADAREITDPEPVDAATADGATTAAAEAGLGDTAQALSDEVYADVREAARKLTDPSTEPPQ